MNNQRDNLARKVNREHSYSRPRPQKKVMPKAQLKVLERENNRAKMRILSLRIGNYFMCGVIVASAISILYMQTNLAVLVKTETELEDTLSSLKSEQVYTNAKIESLFNLGDVETYAKDTLNMINFDSTQTEYVYIENEDKILVNGQDGSDESTNIISRIWNKLIK